MGVGDEKPKRWQSWVFLVGCQGIWDDSGMKKRITLAAGLALSSLAYATDALPTQQAKRPLRQAQDKPNIILIMADDMGYECIGANGCEDYKTPVIDKLAAEGVRFDQCFAHPLCTPTRVAIMTGLYNKRNFTKFAHMDRGQTTFAHLLKKEGYATAIAGKWQLGFQPDSPQHFGFDQSCLWKHNAPGSRYPNPGLSINGKAVQYSNGEYGPDICTDFICDFIETNKDKPFLAYYPMILPHCPFAPTPDSEDWDPTVKGWPYKGPADEALQQKNFGDMVQYIDKLVGRIVNKLDELGIRENTMIIFTADNGTDEPIVTNWKGRKIAGRKAKPFDSGVRVPLVINWPGRIEPAVQKDELVEFSDFLPTLCEVAGAALPENYPGDGLSLWPVLSGSGERNKEYVYIWYFRFNTWVRTKDLGLLCSRKHRAITYQRYPDHYASETLEFDSATESEKVVLKKLEKVLDDMSTQDSLFMGVNAHKGKKHTKSSRDESAKAKEASVVPMVVSEPAPPEGTRYVIGKGQEIEVDGGGGGTFEAVLAFATKTGSTCAILVNGKEQVLLTFPNVQSWSEKKTGMVTLELKPGSNKVEISPRSKKGINFGYIDLKRVP